MSNLAAEVVEGDVFRLDTEVFEHIDHRLVHHGWPTHVVLDILWRRMVFQVVVIQNVVNETRVAML